jgi:7-keto-8-aminopelargonate synthetase-like enzyme
VTEGAFDTMDPAANPAPPGHGRDLFSKFDALIAERQALLDTGVRDPFGMVMEQVLSPTRAIIRGKETILLGTYNYMGMTFDADVVAAGKRALDEFGAGTTGSRVLNGTYQGHAECEQALRDFYAMDHAMVFSTGYQANLGLMSTMAGKEDYIILDADSHASIYDGCFLGDAQIVRFRHNNVEDLEKRLRRLPADAGKLVVLEGVYSMLGDIAPLKEMVAVAKAAGAMIVVDEAHGMGFFGANGRGVFEEAGVEDQIDFVVGTFFQERRHGRRLRRLQSPQIRSAAARLPPLCLHRLAAAERRRHRRHLDPQADACGRQARAPVAQQPPASCGVARARLRPRHTRCPVRDHCGAAARPAATVLMWQALLEAGVYVNMARPPATPTGMYLLRCSLCAEHSDEEVGQIIETFAAAGRAMGVIGG